ncbi:glycoside hydrolase family 28 protein [Zopfia rhizophila CBS 207.26]|uniref:Glycoside hydrolase family 28 protein n=1 Tax=Zopfia rhizophila CBS 207.26 TaxID=1314779 RepID=A0A6A6E5T4_9PEZI|nr:glycoside hydrolase family 28 protein [Zopfia rhizophila CBS 207.26]
MPSWRIPSRLLATSICGCFWNILLATIDILRLSLLISVPFLALSVNALQERKPSNTKFLREHDAYTTLAEGWEQIDDSPAINNAIKTCGNGGTIVLPADQIYSIHSPIDICPYSIFTLAGVKGVQIRSLTRKGIIDGNTIDYYCSRPGSGYLSGKGVAHTANGSSDSTIENIAFKNVMQRLFKVEGNSRNLSFSKPKLSLEQQLGLYSHNDVDTFGFEPGHVSNASIASVDMDFRSRPNHNGGRTGICAAFDFDTRDVSVRDVTCKGACGSVHVMVNTFAQPYLPEASISNIYVANLNFDGEYATGFVNGCANSMISNITRDGVKVVSGMPAVANSCYQRLHGMTAYCAYYSLSLRSTLKNIWRKGFKGKLTSVPDANFGYFNNMTVLDFHFEDWRNETVG